MTKKKLLIITNLYPVPWAENRASFNRQQFELLDKHFDIKKIILVPFVEWFKNRKKAKSTELIHYVPYFYLPKVGRMLYPYFQFVSLLFNYRLIKQFSPHAILASWGYPDSVAVSLLNKLLKRKLFIKVHGTDINGNVGFKERSKLIKKHFNKADGIFSVSNALKEVMASIGVDKQKILVNYNGVDKTIFYPSDKETKNTLLFVGNLIPEKGIKELVIAFNKLQKEYPSLHLRIVGSGPLEAFIKEFSRDTKLNIELLGSLPLTDVASEIRNCTVLVLPSYREGVPNVLLESMSSGIPVVASTVGGIPEVVTEESGLLVEDLVNLDTAISEALSKSWNKEKIVNLSARFDWQVNVNTVKESIERAIAQN